MRTAWTVEDASVRRSARTSRRESRRAVPTREGRPAVGFEPVCPLGNLYQVRVAEGAVLQHGAWSSRGHGGAGLVDVDRAAARHP